MSKFLTFIIFFGFITCNLNAQKQAEFGVKGGLNLTFIKVVEGGFGTNPATEVGYYGGVFVDFKIDNGFHIQPELLYIGISDFRFLNAPIYLKYDIENNFHILIGPSLNYFFDFFVNKFKVRADLSIAYDFTSQLNIHMKYTIGFQEITPNGLFLGLGYRL
ncbi:outer membrane beta-barrel protein [Winogradskyella sp. UBA3174]|uniref:outer membrane beta-barrel protein n=1 Tax=Winogradskyella sp. UBA3174 TaxID=1947785 RepID=UPI0025F053E1|nr:outer membrane beta-barrel protein [Winogradskyella sp. UBA3174]|tara:strand:+ start:6234 stop:6716 length:483 start_codon:yes stop_codon:yes gene_type:complete